MQALRYSTTLEYAIDWTEHKNRLDRDLTGRFGDEAYAGEEMVAELTAAPMCAELSIPGQPRHPEYIGFWLKVLGKDMRAIFTAAGKATEAANSVRSNARPEQRPETEPVGERQHTRLSLRGLFS